VLGTLMRRIIRKKITSVPNHEHLRGMDPPRIFDMSSEIYVLLNVIDVF